MLRIVKPPIIRTGMQSVKTLQDLEALVTPQQCVSSDAVRRRFGFFVQYSSEAVNVDVEGLQQTLSKQLCDRVSRHCTLISVGNRTLVAFVAKNDTSKIRPSVIELPGCKVEAVSTPGNHSRRADTAARAIACYNDCAMECASDLWLDLVPDDVTWSLEHLYKVTEKLDEEGLVTLTGEVKMIPDDKRDKFQQAFWKLRAQLRELRVLRNAKDNALAINLKNRAQHIQPLTVYVHDLLQRPIVIHDASLWPSGRCTVGEFFETPELHLNLTLLIHGGTRLGKSEVAKTLCYAASVQYHGHNACIWFMNTIDSLRTVYRQLLPGHVVLFDEFVPTSVQLVHSDSNMLKADFRTN